MLQKALTKALAFNIRGSREETRRLKGFPKRSSADPTLRAANASIFVYLQRCCRCRHYAVIINEDRAVNPRSK